MKILFVKPVSRFGIEVRFDDGAHGIVDLADIAGRGVFTQWLKEAVFKRVKISSSGALEWLGHRMGRNAPRGIARGFSKSCQHACAWQN